MASTLRSFASLNARSRPTIGDTKTSAALVDHMGWLLCDGRELSTSDYVQLFNMIGYQFGGSGSSFRLPDPQGRVLGIVGQADVSSNTWALGNISGEETHLLTLPEIPAHNHDIDGSDNRIANGVTSGNGAHTHSIGRRSNPDDGAYDPSDGHAAENSAITSNRSFLNYFDISGASNHQHEILSNGGSQRHNNIQPTIWIGNLFIYGGRQWVAATPQSRAIQGPNPLPNTNFYRPQGPPTILY